MMVKEGKLSRIEPQDIPESAAVNQFGQRAQFAVVIQPGYLFEFNVRCSELRA